MPCCMLQGRSIPPTGLAISTAFRSLTELHDFENSRSCGPVDMTRWDLTIPRNTTDLPLLTSDTYDGGVMHAMSNHSAES